jgi:hypothetical protein
LQDRSNDIKRGLDIRWLGRVRPKQREGAPMSEQESMENEEQEH